MTEPLRIVLHAPTAAALRRARNNARNLARAEPPPQVRIVANAEAVGAALDQPEPAADGITLLCANTLRNTGRAAPEPFAVLEQGAVLGVAQMQAQGWRYIRS